MLDRGYRNGYKKIILNLQRSGLTHSKARPRSYGPSLGNWSLSRFYVDNTILTETERPQVCRKTGHWQ